MIYLLQEGAQQALHTAVAAAWRHRWPQLAHVERSFQLSQGLAAQK
jgi:hypothetical protein